MLRLSLLPSVGRPAQTRCPIPFIITLEETKGQVTASALGVEGTLLFSISLTVFIICVYLINRSPLLVLSVLPMKWTVL